MKQSDNYCRMTIKRPWPPVWRQAKARDDVQVEMSKVDWRIQHTVETGGRNTTGCGTRIPQCGQTVRVLLRRRTADQFGWNVCSETPISRWFQI